jgi:hypothetical protein
MQNEPLLSDDTLLEEIRLARAAHARKFNYDLGAIIEDLRKYESGDRVVVSYPSKPARRQRGAA